MILWFQRVWSGHCVSLCLYLVTTVFWRFLGVWIIVGVNFVLRKLAAAASSTMTISVEDGQVRINTKGPKDSDHKFHLDTEVESNDPQDNPMKVTMDRDENQNGEGVLNKWGEEQHWTMDLFDTYNMLLMGQSSRLEWTQSLR